MAEKYVRDDGFGIEVPEIHCAGETGLWALVIQSDEDRQTHVSGIHLRRDVRTDQFEELHNAREWIYSICPDKTGGVWFAHDGGRLSRLTGAGETETVLTTGADLTKLCPASDGLYLIGLNGFIAKWAGGELLDMSLPSETIHHLGESPDGHLFAVGMGGGFWKWEGSAWTRIDLGTNLPLNRVVSTGDGDALIAGSNGYCARVRSGGALDIFAADPGIDYHAVASWRGEAYFGAGFRGLHKVVDGVLTDFKDTVPTYDLATSGEILATAGFNLVAFTFGEGWKAARFT